MKNNKNTEIICSRCNFNSSWEPNSKLNRSEFIPIFKDLYKPKSSKGIRGVCFDCVIDSIKLALYISKIIKGLLNLELDNKINNTNFIKRDTYTCFGKNLYQAELCNHFCPQSRINDCIGYTSN